MGVEKPQISNLNLGELIDAAALTRGLGDLVLSTPDTAGLRVAGLALV